VPFFFAEEGLSSLIVGVAGRVEMLARNEGGVMKTMRCVASSLIGVLVATAVPAQDLRFGAHETSAGELATIESKSAVIRGPNGTLRLSDDLAGLNAGRSGEAGPGETSIGHREVLDSATVVFPLSSDTWDVEFYPNWFNDGDTVHGTRNPSVAAATHADIAFKISRSNLSSGNGGFIDFDFEIDGTPVCFFLITEQHGLGYVYGSCNFPAVTPPFEIRFTEVNTVVTGGGSISLDEDGASWVTFSTRSTPTHIFYDGFESAGTSNWTTAMH